VSRLAVFCPACASTATPAPRDAHSDAIAAFVYGGAVAHAITAMKYRARPDLARPLGDLLSRAVAAELPSRAGLRGALVVPVPLHPRRLAERGYNQAALLARRVAKHMGSPLAPMALARDRDTTRQATLDRQARLENVASSFRARDPAGVRGRAVLLVDDVQTTGATLEACSMALRVAGASTVVTAVVARA
jgi:ComF family protein